MSQKAVVVADEVAPAGTEGAMVASSGGGGGGGGGLVSFVAGHTLRQGAGLITWVGESLGAPMHVDKDGNAVGAGELRIREEQAAAAAAEAEAEAAAAAAAADEAASAAEEAAAAAAEAIAAARAEAAKAKAKATQAEAAAAAAAAAARFWRLAFMVCFAFFAVVVGLWAALSGGRQAPNALVQRFFAAPSPIAVSPKPT